jgi:hypothetical protein
MRSMLPSDMHRRTPDSSYGSGDQYCFSGPRSDPFLDELSSSKDHERKCSRLLEAKVRRNESQIAYLAQNEFRIRMIYEAKDALANLSGFDSIAQADDFTRKITTQNCRELQRHERLQISTTEFPVDGVDARRRHSDQHLSRSRVKVRCIPVSQLIHVTVATH